MTVTNRQYILADADSFFASCERVFRPDLKSQAIVVLSNNDGCVVARSREAKELNISNGTPWFKLKNSAHSKGIIPFSSNYELYASLSHRMMNIMRSFLPHQHIYSIDECFFESDESLSHLYELCNQMREAVWYGIGIPLSISIAPTHTLAKIVNQYSKKHNDQRIETWDSLVRKNNKILSHIPINEVWGIGRHLSPQLMAMNIVTAEDLQNSDDVFLRKKFNVTLQQIVLELREIPCISLKNTGNGAEKKQSNQIIYSRMFGHPVSDKETLRHIIGTYAQKAVHRLRTQSQLCSHISVFCGTSRFHMRNNTPPLRTDISLPEPTDDLLIITQYAYQCISNHAIEGIPYTRAGIVLDNLIDTNNYTCLEIFSSHRTHNLSETLERVRHRFGNQLVGIGYAGIRSTTTKHHNSSHIDWSMKQDYLSQRYTTRWDEMATAYAL